MKKPSRKGKCAKFIKILYSMLRNSQSFLTWSGDQTYFTINNVLGFIQNSLPIYFKHSNLSSFIRQLNLYGFKKLPITNDIHLQNSYYHKYFKKKEPSLLSKIQRRFIKRSDRLTPKDSSLDSGSESGQSQKQVYLQKLQQCQNQLKKLRQQNGGLKLTIKQAQIHILTINAMRMSSFGHQNFSYCQNRIIQAFNNYQANNIGWPYLDYNNLQQQTNTSIFSSINNFNDPNSKESQPKNKQ